MSLLATTFPAGPARTRALGVYGAMAGLLAGAVLFAAGAVVAICAVNARISPAEGAAR